GKLSYQLMKPGVLSPDQEQLLQTLLGDIVEYETHLLKFSNELYSHLKQKEDSSCNSGAEINPGINDRLTAIVDDDETEYNSDIKDHSDTESRAGKNARLRQRWEFSSGMWYLRKEILFMVCASTSFVVT
ncbi:uncharacterized protein LOC128553317, partial [Mercenaria mercenaria]|uniref:uncharacterized protein LOC128553317 n=1 Tax=Mercenaria mercenaria TaxID=6596 RepID=UPI00234E3792